jgi:hypothetical protein
MNRTVVLSGTVSFVMAGMGTVVATTLVTPRLVEAQGASLRAEQVLTVTDNGADRIRLVAGPDNIGALRIFDPEGQLRVHVEMSEGPDGTLVQGVALWNGSVPIVRIGSVGRSAELAGRSLGDANLALRDETGKDRIRLLVGSDGTTFLELIGNTETLVWTVP